MNPNDKIYGLTHFYSEIKYNYGMYNRIDVDLDLEFKKSLDVILVCDNLFDYYQELMRFVTLLNDPHSYVMFPKVLYENYEIGILPIDIIKFESEWYVSAYTKEYDDILEPFMRITQINGINMNDYFDRFVYPYVSNKQYKDTLAIRNKLSLGKITDKLEITIENNTKELKRIILDRIKIETEVDWIGCHHPYNYSKKAKSLYISYVNFFEIIEYENIGILSIWSFTSKNQIDELMKNISLLKSKKNIIIDLRRNAGGAGANALNALSLFTITESFESVNNHRIHNSFYKARAYFKIRNENLITYEKYLEKYKESAEEIFHKCYENYYNRDHLKEFVNEILTKKYSYLIEQPTVLLVGRNTASAAELFAQGFKTLNRGILIGEKTLGAGGQPLMVDLPFGGIAAVCTVDTLLLDNSEFNNIGFIPDILVDSCLNNFTMNESKDLEFEKAFEWFKNN